MIFIKFQCCKTYNERSGTNDTIILYQKESKTNENN